MSISFVYPKALWLLLLIPLTMGLALFGRRPSAGRRLWLGLAVRSLLLLFVILALAGTQVRRRAEFLTAVFVLDASDSISPEERTRGEALIRGAVGAMPRGDRASVVLFGEDALVERLANEERGLPEFTSVPITTRTDVASALQLALALFPDEGAKRLILLSDGRENLGHALDQAELAAAHDIELSYVPLGTPSGDAEALIESLNAPADARQGQGFDLTVVVHSTAQQAAALRVFGDGQLIHSETVRLQSGTNRFLVPVERAEAGFRRFRAQVIPDADTRLQNNEASAFTVVHGPPRVLVVEGQPGEGENLTRALQAAEMSVSVMAPADLPVTLPELAAYDAAVLVNVPATALSPEAMAMLPVYVRDLGRGLLMTGGENAFGAGGYLRTPLEAALPVDMDVRTKEQSPNLALALAIDKSGSMGRCHCDNPDLYQTYVRREVGQPKVDIAKEAVMRASTALGRQDYLGVVAFDNAARWALEMHQLLAEGDIEQAIGGIQASGQTNIRSGVEAAYQALQNVDARQKHLILLTDGWTYSGDITPLARDMKASGVTLSVIAAGGGSAEYLDELAQAGGGRYYAAEDILTVPDLFLKETVKAVGRYLIEEPFYPLPDAPSPVLRGLDAAALPPLLGYNGTTLKGTARQGLATPRGDPLLATWQYGLGRAAAWTSDVKGQWAIEWLTWEGFARFAAQLVGWTLPAPQVEGLSAQATLSEDQAVIRVEATDDAGLPRNLLEISATLVSPELETIAVPLRQVGAGQYEATAGGLQPGTYLVQLGMRDELAEPGEAVGQQTLGLVVPYSPEYRASGIDRGLLRELARLTGGDELAKPSDAFVHNLPAAERAREVWATLLFLAALIFPFDVAIRRLVLGRRDVDKALAWLRAHLPARQHPTGAPERILGQLFQARARARDRRAPQDSEALPPSDRPPAAIPSAGAPPPPQPMPPPAEPGDSLARLREAKKRARRE